MRICYLLPGFCADESDWYIPALTGFIRGIARHADVTIYTLDYPLRRSTYPMHGATVHCLSDGEQHGLHRFFHWCELRHLIHQNHLKEPFDLIHAFGECEPGFLAARVARELDIPSVVSLAVDRPATQRARFRSPFGPMRSLMTRSALGGASIVTTGSSWRSRRMPRRLQSKLATIPLGVDTEMFFPGALRTGHRLLAASSVSPLNDYPTLLRATAIARQTFPDITLDIAGMSFLRMMLRLEPLIRRLGLHDAVRFLGPVPYAEMPATFREHDLLLHSPTGELQGMAVLEALSTGMPVVSSNVGIAASLPKDLLYRFPPGDVNAMAASIVRSLASINHSVSAHNAGHDLVSQYFSIHRTMDTFLRLYHSLEPVPLGTYYWLPDLVPAGFSAPGVEV